MKTSSELILHALNSFDHENKMRLGELVVTALEAKEEDNVVERAEGILNRTLSDEEAFRLRTLVRFYYSRGGFEDSIPDSAPEIGGKVPMML